MSALPSVDSEWKDYAKMVIPKNARENQRVETRKAFYAGAFTILEGILPRCMPMSEVDADKYLNDIRDEIRRFVDNVGGEHN